MSAFYCARIQELETTLYAGVILMCSHHEHEYANLLRIMPKTQVRTKDPPPLGA